MTKAQPVVGQAVFKVIETGDGIEVMQRTITKLTPTLMVFDRPFPFSPGGTRVSKATFEVSYHSSERAAIEDYRDRAERERDNARARAVSQEARIAWADKQTAKQVQPPQAVPHVHTCLDCEAAMSMMTTDHAYGYDGGAKIRLRDLTVWRCANCGHHEVAIPQIGPLNKTIRQALSVLRVSRENMAFFFERGDKGIEDGSWGVIVASMREPHPKPGSKK